MIEGGTLALLWWSQIYLGLLETKKPYLLFPLRSGIDSFVPSVNDQFFIFSFLNIHTGKKIHQTVFRSGLYLNQEKNYLEGYRPG